VSYVPVDHEEWLRQFLLRDPIFQASLRRKYRELYDEAQRLLESGCINWLERSRDNAVYRVSPVVFEVKKVRGQWFCQCENFSRYGMCEHILAVQIKGENE